MKRRWLAMGDPQTTFAKVLHILGDHALIDEGTGMLREDIGLVSMGDHFDFHAHGARTLAETSRDGVDTLEWLAKHPPDQVVILMGNHDASRVMELAFESDESFAAARTLAEACATEDPPGENNRLFATRHPRIPTPDIAIRDYGTFTVEQRSLVQKLLLTERMQLACIGWHLGKPALMTHAAVLEPQVAALGVEPRAEPLQRALQRRLRDAIARVRCAWERNELAALDLEPLHSPGQTGREGGGLLYQRPSGLVDETGDGAPMALRRFHPRLLPRGLVQICGHTGHKKCLKDLESWLGPSARSRTHGGLRTLAVSDSRILYDAAVHAAKGDDATLYFTDIEMNAPEVSDYPLLELERVETT
jgi:hypothetical protein